MNETAGSLELLEPVSPEALVPDPWLEPWMIPLAGALLLGLLALVIFLRRKPAKPDPRAARQAAFREAAAALDAVAAPTARDAAVQCSLIVRRYVSRVAGDPALFETHEETVSRHQAFGGFSDEARAAAGAGFSRLATMKYAEKPAAAEPGVIVAEARELLNTLHRGFQG